MEKEKKPARHRRAASLRMVAAVGFLATACTSTLVGGDRVEGSGEVTTDTRVIATFDRIVLAGEGQVLFGSGSDGEIEIETDDNLVSHIEADVSGDTLTIGTRSGVDIDPTQGVTYRLGCPELTAASLRGAGTIDLNRCATTAGLELELTGAGTIVAPELDVSSLRAVLSGAGNIEAEGRADRLEVVVSGAGNFDGADLQATDGGVESTGAGQTWLWVTDTLDARLTGVGNIRYYGEPTVTTTVTGVGAIEALGPK